MKKLLNFKRLSAALDVPVPTLRTWAKAKKIPMIDMGWRSKFFDEDDVREALKRFTVKAIGE